MDVFSCKFSKNDHYSFPVFEVEEIIYYITSKLEETSLGFTFNFYFFLRFYDVKLMKFRECVAQKSWSTCSR